MSRTYGKAQDLIDFTRASSGTALRRVKYGAELVTNGGFDTDSNWTLGTGWSISGGKLVGTSVPNFTVANQSIALEAGKLYQLTIVVSESAGGTVRAGFLNGTTVLATDNIPDARTVTVNVIALSGNDKIFIGSAGSGFTGSIDSISLKEVTFDTSDGDLVLFNHPNNIPRIEYDANGNLLGLLVEESRTNKITYSEDFSNSYWQKTDVTLSAASVKAPDGSYTATKVAVSGGNPHMVRQAVASSGDCKSIWARTVSGTGTVALLALFASGDKIVTLTEEWQRFDILYDDETGAVPDFFYAVDFRGSSTLTEAIIWGAQVEQGSFPTSYIPTNGSTATRSADVASIDVDAFGFNDEAGTVVLEAESAYLNGIGRTFVLSDGTTNNRIQSVAYFNSHLGVVSGGVTQANIDAGTFTEDAFSKFSGAYKQNDFSASIDGGAAVTDTAGDVPSNITTMNIGSAFGTSSFLNGHIKSIKYYPRRLLNTQLVELTS